MKKIISILIVITVIINVIGFGFLNVRSSAEAGVAIGVALGSLIIGMLSSMAGKAIQDSAPALDYVTSDYYINDNALSSGELLQIGTNYDGTKYFYISGNAANSAAAEEVEFAEYLCNNLNNDPNVSQYIQGFSDSYDSLPGGQFEVSASLYQGVKNSLLNSFNDMINAQAQAEAASGLGDALSELGAVTTPFDFTGPLQPSLTLPSSSGAVSLNLNGFTFLTPSKYTSTGYQTESEALAHGDTAYSGSRGYWPKVNRTCYGTFYYAIYGGDVYYAVGDISLGYSNYDRDVFVSNYDGFTNSSGQTLSSVPGYNMWDDSFLNALSVGVGIYTDQSSAGYLPYEYTYNANDFTEVIPGDTVGFERTPAEEAIGSAIGLNLISGNPTISIGKDGSIEAVDGISLDTIEALVSQLTDGTVQKFDDIEGYLQNIASLLSNGNADRRTIETILDNISSKVGSIDDINAKLDSIAQALTIDTELEIDKEDIELNAIIGEHTGLVEANDFVSRWELVNQCKQLLNNVLNGNQYSNNPPNFIFYYDSNGDGIKETYNALDLSFLERTLTNENIGDKNRFQNPMTVREFIQLLMIFICYLAFSIKLLRKLPGLVSGGESAAGDGLEIKHIEDAHGTNIRNLIP